ncbi:hypothetical protein [Sphingobacterium sp.]|uniref:hypothetical protein n=1 Tax=Sphingobacterium sp. TaxID=341027 RepID=UPI0028B0BAB3|nr:hypothetical protein [Sphingobacterium sp.]
MILLYILIEKKIKMNFKQVNEFIEANKGVIGEVNADGQEVTHLFPVPTDGSNFSDIITAIIMDYDHSAWYAGHNDFTAYVLYDGDDPMSSLLIYDTLERYLEKRG